MVSVQVFAGKEKENQTMHADTHCGDIGHPTPLCIERKSVTHPKQFQALFKSILGFWLFSVFCNVHILRKTMLQSALACLTCGLQNHWMITAAFALT